MLRALLILSKEKNRTLRMLAKTLIPLLLKNLKRQLVIHTLAPWQCLCLEPWDVERFEQPCLMSLLWVSHYNVYGQQRLMHKQLLGHLMGRNV
jgi:hypothetical protein